MSKGNLSAEGDWTVVESFCTSIVSEQTQRTNEPGEQAPGCAPGASAPFVGRQRQTTLGLHQSLHFQFSSRRGFQPRPGKRKCFQSAESAPQSVPCPRETPSLTPAPFPVGPWASTTLRLVTVGRHAPLPASPSPSTEASSRGPWLGVAGPFHRVVQQAVRAHSPGLFCFRLK